MKAKLKKKYKKKKQTKILFCILMILTLILVSLIAISGKFYLDVKKTVNSTYTTVDRSNEPAATKRKEKLNLNDAQPFSVLLLGIDTGDLGRTDQGRSDTMILATVNPQNKKMTLVSLERDIYTEIVGHNTTEKLNSAYAYGGVPMAMNTVEKLVGVPIDHYITLNLKGLKELVDAVGGITVSNELDFKYGGTHFSIGETKLNGDTALKYSRMRYEDPEGNYGRQKRQRAIIEALVKKILTVQGMSNYQSILTAMGGNVTTDIKFSDISKLIKNYRESFETIGQEQLQGEGFMENEISYQKVSSEELSRVTSILKEQLLFK